MSAHRANGPLNEYEIVLERSLRKTILVVDVVDAVYDVERVHARSVDVDSDGRGLCRVLDELKVEIGAGFGRGRGLRALEGDSVVSARCTVSISAVYRELEKLERTRS